MDKSVYLLGGSLSLVVLSWVWLIVKVVEKVEAG